MLAARRKALYLTQQTLTSKYENKPEYGNGTCQTVEKCRTSSERSDITKLPGLL
jgi:hypothetical protein